ncbi:MAG: TonB-dependent receptor [Prolixibacteraceae bacterium]|nr:TonB-dependent receptor [Prolixibacteraceae bacterium]
MKTNTFIGGISGLLACLFGIALQVPGQEPQSDIYELNFNELAKLKVVTVSKTEQSIDEIPATVRVITAREINNRAYQNLEDVLADLPGFQFRNIQSINSYVFQRGIPNQNNLMLVMIDGVLVNELNSGGFYAGAQYDLKNVERIEVVYGPSSVGYGTNAISGIVNIISKTAQKTGGGISGTTGGFSTQATHGWYNLVNDERQFQMRVTGMVHGSNRANLKGAAGDHNWSDLLDLHENNYHASLRARYQNFTFGSNYLNKQTSLGAYRKSSGTANRDFGTNWNILFLNNFLKYNRQINDQFNWSWVLYHRNTTVLRNTVYEVTDTAQVGYYRPNNLIGLENLFSYHFNDFFTMTGGVMFEYEKLAKKAVFTYSNSMFEAPPLPGSPDFQNNLLASVFVEPNLHITHDLFLSGGLRFDNSSVYQQVLTPRAGINFNPGRSSFLLAYAEAFRAPKPWDYYDGAGNPNLLPETMKSMEIAIKYAFNEHWHSSANLYLNKLHNGIVKEGSGATYRWTNSGIINTKGLEWTMFFSSQKLEGALNYTYTSSVDESGRQLPEISAHTANAGVTLLLKPSLSWNLRAAFVGERENNRVIASTQTSTIDPFCLLNSALTWKPFQAMTIQLIGRNLLNVEYYHPSNGTPDRYRQPQRMLLLMIAYEFEK